MSALHDVVIYLLHSGLVSSETVRDELIAKVEADRAAQAAKDAPPLVFGQAVVAESEPEPPRPRFDPDTGERLQ